MSPEKEEQLCNKYPLIFNLQTIPPGTPNRWWGFECGDGWFNIIDSLCSCIQSYINQKNVTMNSEEKEEFQVTAVQVKEKFGGLRFYIYGGDENVQSMIRVAESISNKICEKCGAPGNKTRGGWIRTLCSTCSDGLNQNTIEYT